MENALLPRTVNLRLVAIVNIYATLAGNGRGNGVEEYKDIKVQYMQTTRLPCIHSNYNAHVAGVSIISSFNHQAQFGE